MDAIGSADELRRNPGPLAFTPHTAFEHIGGPQLLADRAQVLGLALELKRGSAADHSHPIDAGERIQDFLGEPVGKEFVLLVRAHVHKRQYRDGFLLWASGSCAAAGNAQTSYEKQCNGQRSADQRDINPSAILRNAFVGKIDIFGGLDSFRCQLEYPCDDERDWKSNDDCE